MERNIEGDIIEGDIIVAEKRGRVGKTEKGTETERRRKRGRKRK